MKTIAVIGKNYGDEGKGLVTASLCSVYEYPLVVKHNGGGQAGHTVENEETKTRFIHHQIGSGAEYGADTLFADSFHPDLFQIKKEVDKFSKQFGFIPKLYGEAKTKITTIDDVLINMAIETQRKEARHGSCGMGINECFERIQAGYAISLEEVAKCTSSQLADCLKKIRTEYSTYRMKQLGVDNSNPYWDMLHDETLLYNFAEEISKNISLIQIVDANYGWLNQYDGVIFETGQGLLLDQDYLENMPYLTPSKTGITEPVNFLTKREMKLDEAVYVTRSYVTKHGAGPLPNEFSRTDYLGIQKDMTNEPNEWQGSIRYGKHKNTFDFMKMLSEDINKIDIKPSLAVTHLNETEGMLLFEDSPVLIEQFIAMNGSQFQNIYVSWDRQNIQKL